MRWGALTMMAVAACSPDPAQMPDGPALIAYDGVETRLLDDDLVNIRTKLRGAKDEAAVQRYSECAAAQYTLIRGFGFARHLRTTVTQENGAWRADAIYTISPDLPRGSRTLDAEVVVSNCTLSGIPTV